MSMIHQSPMVVSPMLRSRASPIPAPLANTKHEENEDAIMKGKATVDEATIRRWNGVA